MKIEAYCLSGPLNPTHSQSAQTGFGFSPNPQPLCKAVSLGRVDPRPLSKRGACDHDGGSRLADRDTPSLLEVQWTVPEGSLETCLSSELTVLCGYC